MALLVARPPAWQQAVRRAAWYQKRLPTFSDALAQGRRALWREMRPGGSLDKPDPSKGTSHFLDHLGELLAG